MTNYLDQKIHEILAQMVGKGKVHPNPLWMELKPNKIRKYVLKYSTIFI